MRFSLKRNQVLAVGIGIFLILAFNFFQAETRNFFHSVSAPIQNAFWGAGDAASDFFKTLFGSGGLKNENEELRRENRELLSVLAEFKNLEEENKELKEALGLQLNEEFKLILADISCKDPLRDAVFVNKGSEDGVSVNLPVITSEKTLVGRIEEVFSDFSRVGLVSDEESSFGVRIFDADSAEITQGVVSGEGGGEVILDFLPQKTEIDKGSLVVTAGFDGIFPEGLLVGEVKTVPKASTAPFKKAEVEAAFKLGQEQKVFIVSEF